ncbi:hypothetical protein SLS55_006791 [Diplodia seriata]|uniref:Heterokaryon incompatibility domain-containing protein n=2 Tax=Diplodia seriata TaxID=420778 RepID=A0ABR3CAH1_9PEZI
MCCSHGFFKYKLAEWEKQLKEYSDPCVHMASQTCEDCQHIPVFPSGGGVSRFRITRLRPKDVQPKDLSRCTHFLAVSYCWSSQGSPSPGANEKPYTVVEEDGTTRPMRTQKVTIDRVVNYAIENGYRMIWIDQECIEQDNPEEKELGVQAMDIVYLRANMSVGLCQTVLQQKHLDALLLYFEVRLGSLLRRRGPRPLRSCRTLRLADLSEALRLVADDPWNSRAWILQEAFASSGNMTLLFPKAKNVNVRGWTLVCHEMSLTEIAIKLDILQECLRISTACVQHFLREKITKGESHWRKTLDKLRWFHPERPKHGMNFWVNDFKPRRTCNAAVALSYLKTRENSRVVDRVAIVANLCGYDYRLNTTELDALQPRLGLCILVLSIKNGDLSLLVPELYQGVQTINPEDTTQRANEFSWAMPWTKQLQLIEAESLSPSGPAAGATAAFTHSISDRGLSFPGLLWRVDEFISLAPIKDKYAEPWFRLTRSNNDPKLKSKGKQTNSPAMSRNHRLAATQILFEILMFLRETGQREVADAILNSVGDFKWRNRDGHAMTIVESVDEFPDHLRMENRKGMFQLGAKSEGGFHQEWLINRVLDQGGLWLGRAISSPTDETGWAKRAMAEEQDPAAHAAESLTISASRSDPQIPQLLHSDSGSSDMHVMGRSDLTARSNEPNPAESQEASTRRDERSQLKIKRHGQGMLGYSMLTKVLEYTMLQGDGQQETEDSTESFMMLRPAVLATFAVAVNSNIPYRASYAVFDTHGSASGDVLVLTPFQQLLESIPRPDIRSLSISWIVEPVAEMEKGELIGRDGMADELIKARLRAKGMISFSYQLLRTAIRQYPQDRTLRLVRKTPQSVITGCPADGRQSPLHTACEVLDADIVAALLEKGADANVRTADGETPLHCALSPLDPPRKGVYYKTSRLKIVTMLLAAGADASATDEDGSTALHLAILHGHTDCARLMLAHDDTALTMPNKRGEIPLFVTGTDHLSTTTPTMDMAEFLTRWHILNRPLHRAVASGDIRAVHEALASGQQDVSARSMLGDAAVHLAAVRADVTMVRFLLSQGASASQAGYLGQTALHRAATACGQQSRDARAIDSPVQQRWTDAETALFRSVSEYRQHTADRVPLPSPTDCLEAAQSLLDDVGVSPAIPDALLRTPLHLAAAAGSEAIVQLLLSHGADPDAPDLLLRTPVWHAAASGAVDVMAALFRHGASLHLRPDQPFRDAGRLAVQCGRRCVSADMLNAADGQGRTALIRAVQAGSVAAAGHLLRAGAYAGQLGKGWSPVVQACEGRHWGVARLLVARGADVRECEREPRTSQAMALHLAARGGDVGTIRAILRAEEARAEEGQVEHVAQKMESRSPAPSRRPSVQSFRSSVTMGSAWSGGGGGGASKMLSPTAKAIGFYKWTPLHYAASMRHRDAVGTLLGVMERMEIIARDIDGFTAQELAKEAGYEEIVELIEDRLT